MNKINQENYQILKNIIIPRINDDKLLLIENPVIERLLVAYKIIDSFISSKNLLLPPNRKRTYIIYSEDDIYLIEDIINKIYKLSNSEEILKVNSIDVKNLHDKEIIGAYINSDHISMKEYIDLTNRMFSRTKCGDVILNPSSSIKLIGGYRVT